MESLIIEPGVKTPFISFVAESGMLEMKGRSIPENSVEFYRPMFEWLDLYSKTPAAKTELRVQLEYFNTSSSKCLLDIFRKLAQINASSKSAVTVKWFYEEQDEDMKEAGEDYQTLVTIPFSFEKM
jgi:hypothetical protein